MNGILNLTFAVALVAVLGAITAASYAQYHSAQFRDRWWQDTPSDKGSARKSEPLTWVKLEIPETARSHGRKARAGVVACAVCFIVAFGMWFVLTHLAVGN